MERCAMPSAPKEAVAEATETLDLRSAYDRYAGPLYWYALSLLECAEEAEDVVHEVFAALLRRGDAAIHCPRAYLFTAARRHALDIKRRRSVPRGLDEEVRTSWIDTGAEQALAIDVDRALRSLPLEQREIVTLKVLEDLTFREIAQVLRIPANTAASRYRLALAKLRAELRGGEDDA